MTALHALLPGLARLVGEMDPEASMGLAGPVRDRLFRLVERHGGVIHQLGEDSLTAVFGTGAGTESSPIEAGRTALAILAEEPSAWIGLHAGEAVVGETSEVGAVALAARMLAEGAAAGSVLISKTASRLCEGYFEAEPGPPLPSTGLETVRLTGLSPARNSWQARAGRVLSPFSGRQDELAELHRGFARLDRGATVAMITAEAGLGKSRLVHEFLASPEIAGPRVLRTGVAVFDVETTHSALGTLLRDWAGIRTDDRQDRIWARVRDRLNQLGSEAAGIAQPLRLLLDLPVEDPLWSTLSPGQQRHRVIDALRTILECECRDGPVILVFEDAHWIDGETLQVLQALISSLGAAPVLVIVTCRPEFRPLWAGNSAVRQIRLEPLETDAAERLLDGLMGDTTDVGAIRAAVLDRSGGVPLFLEEMVRDLRETGQFHAGVGHLTIETPATVRGVIAARIERLPAPARRVLQIASVIGVETPAALLEPLVEPESVDLGEALLTLAEAELFYRTRGGPDASYAFKHAMTQDVAYRSLLIAHREPLHARLLDLCEAHWADRRAEHVERLADHARLGAVWDRAAVYLSEAGERAVQRTDFGRARVHFVRALDALRRLPSEPSVWRRMAELHLGMRAVLNMAGDYEDILGHLDAAAALADKVDDDPLRAQVQIHLNYFLNSIGDFERCAGPADLAELLAAQTGDPQLISEAALARGQMLRLMADYPGTIAVMEGSLDMWLGERRHHRGGHLGTRSIWALGHLAISYANVGRIEDARRSAVQAIEIAGETRRPTDMQFAIHHQAIVDRFDGRLAEALSSYQEAIEIVVAADLHYFHPWIAANRGEALLAAGRIGDALQALAGALAATEGTALDRLSPRAAVGLGKAQLLSGDIEGAEATLRRAIARAREFRQDYLESIALRQLAGLLKLAAPTEAASLLHRANRLSAWAPLADPAVAVSRARAIRDELGLPI